MVGESPSKQGHGNEHEVQQIHSVGGETYKTGPTFDYHSYLLWTKINASTVYFLLFSLASFHFSLKCCLNILLEKLLNGDSSGKFALVLIWAHHPFHSQPCIWVTSKCFHRRGRGWNRTMNRAGRPMEVKFCWAELFIFIGNSNIPLNIRNMMMI